MSPPWDSENKAGKRGAPDPQRPPEMRPLAVRSSLKPSPLHSPDRFHTSEPLARCALCGLPLRKGRPAVGDSGGAYQFCCLGCRQVFRILMEASDAADPSNFKQTDLFRQCVQAGIVPATEDDLERRYDETGLEPPDPGGASVASETAVPPSTGLDLNLRVGNMWCPACAWLIDTALKKLPGVMEAACNFSTDRLQVRYDPVQTAPDRIAETVAKLGYRVSPATAENHMAEQRREWVRFGISAFLSMNVMMLSFALYQGFFIEYSPENVAKLSWPMFVMAGIVLTYGGWALFRKAWAGLKNLAFSMETLIVIGALSAFIYSTVSFVSGSIHLYFDTACMLITLVLLGKGLENRAKRKVLEDLEAFFDLMPTKVRICSSLYPRGRYAALGQLAPGDELRVEAGEIVPADGRVRAGHGVVDESAVTGEPLPVTKRVGANIVSGSRILRGDLRVEARRVGEESTLGEMMRIIQQTLLAQTHLEGKTDRILQWFVPTILFLAAATALTCMLLGMSTQASLLRAVTVAVISCPCALGVAIPLARVAGVSIAGRRGMLVRAFRAFEQSAHIDTFVFDKTGTATYGEWKLLRILPLGEWDENQLLALAAGLETDSEHAIAHEILMKARKLGIQPEPIEEIADHSEGRRGRYKGQVIKFGSQGFLGHEFRHANGSLRQPAGIDFSNQSPVYMSCNGRPAAVFVFGDALRSGMTETVGELQRRGYDTFLISGDHQRTTQAVARELGIKQAFGNQLPADKAAFIERLQGQRRRVAMVGDGINDAPALLRADLSFGVHSGGSLGQDAADISFMRGEPAQLPAFFDFARRVNRKIHQNLLFTFLYNVVGIPLAMSGVLNPLIAVCAMLLSSISVTGNTLLLIAESKRPEKA
jgi:heavy metal translocating P-type ATPase